MIEIDSLTKRRAGKPVLDGVSLRGAEAGVTVLVKGSRFMRMERVVAALCGPGAGGAR